MKISELENETFEIDPQVRGGVKNAALIGLPLRSCADSTADFQDAVHKLEKRQVAEALARLNAAGELGHDPNECSAHRWTCQMLLGNFEAAWRECDAIFERGAGGPLSLWDRQAFIGKRVVIRCLHGYGDAIQFLRYAPLIARTASKVIVETHPEMVSLVSLIAGVDRVTTWTEGHRLQNDEWDQQIEVTELPWAFRSTVADLPSRIPYVNVSCGAHARSPVAAQPLGKLRVGILWASSSWNPQRSIPLAEFAPFLGIKDCHFYSFQRGPEREQLASIRSRYIVRDTAAHSLTIRDTAADLTNMDLLITVDTMAAHLAGALGIRVWVMLPFEADWRWMLHRDDSPWYPTMKLFRQERAGHWSEVVDRVAQALTHFQQAVQPHTRMRQAAIPLA